jgi:ABC-2 type transport system permease protein
MKWFWKKSLALISVYYAYMVEYRAELILWALSGALPLILMGVWIKASQSVNFGLEGADFARYFLSVFIIRQLTIVWVIWEFEKEVVEGKLSFLLLQPLDPVWRHLAMHIAERFARLPFIVFFIFLFFFLYPEARWIPSWLDVLLSLIAVFLAFVLRFLIQYSFALFSFWTERASAIDQFLFLFYLFFSGYIAPLEVFPPLVKEIALWTPFPYFIHFPAALIIGLPVDFGRGVLVIFIWSFLFYFWNRYLWRKGLKKYSGMGA